MILHNKNFETLKLCVYTRPMPYMLHSIGRLLLPLQLNNYFVAKFRSRSSHSQGLPASIRCA